MGKDALIIDLYDELDTLPHLIGLLGRPCQTVGALWSAMLTGSTLRPGMVFANIACVDDLEMVRRVRSASWGSDVMFVGVADTSMRTAVLEEGCDAHLGKPIRFLRLKPLMDAWVSGARVLPGVERSATRRGVRANRTIDASVVCRRRAASGDSAGWPEKHQAPSWDAWSALEDRPLRRRSV